ncbi:MAG: EFR1 family ferrodoxin [Sphaerochaetaceae bacterium]|nr:EFR1 family ferrodoxin [Sphaerochaetaceae bacterium]
MTATQSAILYVFSGTKNTLTVAEMISAKFKLHEIACTISQIGKAHPSNTDCSQYDYIGFLYPIHAFNTPKPMVDFARLLPVAVDKQRAFIVKVSGEPFSPNAASSEILMGILNEKGYRLFFERHLLMPYNIWFRYPDGIAKHMYRFNQTYSELIVYLIIKGEAEKPRLLPLSSRIIAFLFRIQWPGARLNGRLHSVDRTRCIRCTRCVAECPMGNISQIGDSIRFGWSCAMCMRCVCYCPTDAIHIGILRFWKVNGPYDYKRLADDPLLPFPYITDETCGYFKLFRPYYRAAELELATHGICLTQNRPYVTMNRYTGGIDT